MSGLTPPANGNTSATGGYLVPTSGPVTSTADLQNLFAEIIAGLTGIPATLVRPRWQPTPAVRPSLTTDWCAFGIVKRHADANPAIDYIGDDTTGQARSHRTIKFETLCTFYGPNSAEYAEILRDGLRITQNLEPLLAINAGLHSVVDESVLVPELINEQWVDRTDLTINFVQREIRFYPIKTILTTSSSQTIDEAPPAQLENMVQDVNGGSIFLLDSTPWQYR